MYTFIDFRIEIGRKEGRMDRGRGPNRGAVKDIRASRRNFVVLFGIHFC